MLLWALRALFVVLIAAVAFTALGSNDDATTALARYNFWFMLAAIGFSFVLIGIDMFLPRKSLAALSGAFLGLVVGMVAAYGLGIVLQTLVDTWWLNFSTDSPGTIAAIKLMIGVVCCYLSISFILQTKDDIRFVIPYVEFSKQARGSRPLILDTSVIIDGRVADICDTWIIDSPLVVPKFVLQELQAIADSADKLRRNRGRRGLDMLYKLQSNEKLQVRISEGRLPNVDPNLDVDQKLVELAKKTDGRIVTNDYNLNKIAQLRGVDVININDLTNALKPVVLPGETIIVKIIKPGEEAGQGVGYLDDGTMVVAENSRDKINTDVTLAVTSVLQTSAGRMIFGRPDTDAAAGPRRGRGKYYPSEHHG